MGRNRLAATIAIGVAAAASVVSVATIAFAAPDAAGKTGQFATWSAAQTAAGFRLMKPLKTYGLRKADEVSVARCEISKKKAAKRNVIGGYGLTYHHTLTLSQNNSNGPCAKAGQSTSLATYKVRGAKAYLTGLCGSAHFPACTSTKIILFLTWRKGGVYYQAQSFGEPRRVILGFARSLVGV
ncbi:MAG TPA: hypothetical protein VMA95_22870 [Streptosporangiaceae bacterium]|nr:hypothetical protein [Streptosporangiaceae bacterium]